MKTTAFVASKLNAYSVVGSLAYGLLCASTTLLMPSTPFPFYSVYTFVLAAPFYFGMYLWYTSKPRQGFFRFLLMGFIKITLSYMAGLLVGGFIYSMIYKTVLAVGVETVSNWGVTVLYYLPFIP